MHLLPNISVGLVIVGTWITTDNASMEQKTSSNFDRYNYTGPHKRYTFFGVGTFQNG